MDSGFSGGFCIHIISSILPKYRNSELTFCTLLNSDGKRGVLRAGGSRDQQNTQSSDLARLCSSRGGRRSRMEQTAHIVDVWRIGKSLDDGGQLLSAIETKHRIGEILELLCEFPVAEKHVHVTRCCRDFRAVCLPSVVSISTRRTLVPRKHSRVQYRRLLPAPLAPDGQNRRDSLRSPVPVPPLRRSGHRRLPRLPLLLTDRRLPQQDG